ncbi:MAG: iron-sulfur cluster assembly scaffold protein [Clostridia bacterium]|nr:iron-sulfur cluster assembly scaffold protein [Clostridia bacterium]
MYSQKVIDLFTAPHNAGVMENPSAVGVAGSPDCGDTTTLYLKIEGDKITQAMFQTFGCAAAIASSSVLTDLLVGKTLSEALKITNKDAVEALGGLPEAKIHCSVMAEESVRAAVNDYLDRQAAQA